MAILLAYIFSKMMFSSYETEQVMKSSENIYLLQYGSYINKEVMDKNISKLDDYILYEKDNKYYIYVGAYTSIETTTKMRDYFNNQKIYTYIKNDYLDDLDTINDIDNLDKKILNEKDYKKNKEYNKKILDLLKKRIS